MSAELRLPGGERPWLPGPQDVLVGVDVVELVSSSMYVDPLAIYREYIQNSADAIDEARAAGELSVEEDGRVEIAIDSAARRIVVRDNGYGVHGDDFVRRLTAFGASEKRGQARRGW